MIYFLTMLCKTQYLLLHIHYTFIHYSRKLWHTLLFTINKLYAILNKHLVHFKVANSRYETLSVTLTEMILYQTSGGIACLIITWLWTLICCIAVQTSVSFYHSDKSHTQVHSKCIDVKKAKEGKNCQCMSCLNKVTGRQPSKVSTAI